MVLNPGSSSIKPASVSDSNDSHTSRTDTEARENSRKTRHSRSITIPELKPAIGKFILPEALFWFRWAAMATIVTGLILAQMNGYLLGAIKLGIGDHSPNISAIGFGMWLGAIMWFNVWFIIWPNQKKVLGLTPASDDEKKAAARLAGLTSRANTLLSIPMLYCMMSASHGVF